MEKLKYQAISSMNYLFLNVVCGRTQYPESVIEELNMFLITLHNALEEIKQDEAILNAIRQELIEGTYLVYHTREQFKLCLELTIEGICGQPFDDIVAFYMSLCA